MNIHVNEATFREEPPENYRQPGLRATPLAVSPSTNELLGLLNAFADTSKD